MRIISKIFLFSILIISPLRGQESNAKISIKDTIELLMDLKKEINKSQKLTKIQVFSGSRSKAIAVLNNFKTDFPSAGARIKYETPNYKVWTKPFKTRLEADRELIKIRKKYKSAFSFKP